MTGTTHHGGRADEPARRGRAPGRSAAGGSADGTSADGEGLADLRGPAPAWLRGLATTALLTAFVVWGVVLGVGAESMYELTTYVGEGESAVMAAVSLTLTALGAALLLVRRHRPLLVAGAVGASAAVMLLVAGAGNGYELAVAAVLFTVAATRTPRTTWVTAVAVVVPLLVVARFAPRVQLVGGLAMGDRPDQTDPVVRLALPGLLGEVLPPSWLFTASGFVVLALLGLAFGTAVRDARLRAAEAVAAAAARGAEAEQRARVTQADERARVAREMHDVIAHSITVMVALGGGAAAALDRSPEQARRALDELVRTGQGALGDVRRILGVLHEDEDAAVGSWDAAGAAGTSSDVVGASGAGVSGADAGGTDTRGADARSDGTSGPAPLAPQPGGTDLPALVERFRTAGLPVRTSGLAVTGLDDLPASLQLAVYRVVQESLTNALRHAPGTPGVDVAVRRRADAVEVVVTDQGPGDGEPAGDGAGTGRGIVGMRERAAAFGGTVEAGPHRRGPDGTGSDGTGADGTGPHAAGWRVRAVLPLGAAASEGEA